MMDEWILVSKLGAKHDKGENLLLVTATGPKVLTKQCVYWKNNASDTYNLPLFKYTQVLLWLIKILNHLISIM